MRSLTGSLLLTLALAAPAEAARSWKIERVSGTSVMDEISPLVFRVTNTSTRGERIGAVILRVDQRDFDIDGGTAPAGWAVNAIDRNLRQVIYGAEGLCAGGLAPGESAEFELRVIGRVADADVPNQRLDLKRTDAIDVCTEGYYPDPTSEPAWSRVGLHPTVTATPRSLGVGGTVTVTLHVTNNSSSLQTAIAPVTPQAVGDATFFPTSGPTPATLSLAPGAGGSFSWTFTALTEGSAVFRASAANGRVSSPAADSLLVNVGSFPADTDLLPSSVISGQTVDVVLTVSNNSRDPAQAVVPLTPAIGGGGSAALVSGPSPASVAWLPGGGATSFRWTYRITGTVGATFQFTAQATATRAGQTITSDPVTSAVGQIVSTSVVASPAAIANNSTQRAIAYTVFNGGTAAIDEVQLLAPDKSVFVVAANPYSADTSGWTTAGNYTWSAPSPSARIAPGQSRTFTLLYARVGPVTANATYSHKFWIREAGKFPIRVETPVTIFVARDIPEVSSLVAVSGSGRNTLVWNNPADHDGVLIVRSANTPPNAAPVPGTSYLPGQTVGNATVVYADSKSFASSFVDATAVNGTGYFYRVFNHDPYAIYSPGSVPNVNGLYSVPTPRTGPTPFWCYSVGFPSTQQPVVEREGGATTPGKGVLTSGNTGRVTSNVISASDATQDGSERWRPMPLQATVANRLISANVQGHGAAIVTGDQSGRAYLMSSSDGRVLWVGNGGAPLGEALQAQPMVQFSNTTVTSAAFKAANGGRDLLYFATRNDSSATNNKVYALSSIDGSVVWQYAPGDLDMVNGGMFVDYARDRLWVAARGGGGPSLRVLSTLDGSEVKRLAVGDVDYGILADLPTGQAYVVNTAGRVHGIDIAAVELKWTWDVGATSSYVLPMGSSPTLDPATQLPRYRGGFIASLKSGAVEYWTVEWLGTAAPTIARLWSTPVSTPSGVSLAYNPVKVYVGGGDGKLHRLDGATGADEAQLPLSTTGVGMPFVDRFGQRIAVGTVDGRICSLPLSF